MNGLRFLTVKSAKESGELYELVEHLSSLKSSMVAPAERTQDYISLRGRLSIKV